MLDIRLKWIDAGESVDELSSATMAELEMCVGDLGLTAHVDGHSHSSSIAVPLYPIAEWVAAWWWALFHEHGSWDIGDDQGYLERHDMSYAAAGFALPSVVFQPTGEFVCVGARRLARSYSSVEFLSEGSRTEPLAGIQAQLADLVTAVAERLEQRGIANTTLQEDWAAIQAMRGDEQQFSRVAGCFGMDPFDMGEADAATICDLAETAEPSLQDDLYTLGTPQQTAEVLGAIRQTCEMVDSERPPATWEKLAREAPRAEPGAMAWQAGYDAARWVRDRLKLDGQPLAFEGDMTVPAVGLPVEHARLTGVVSSRSPACAVKAHAEVSRRFTMARSVGDYVTRGKAGPTLLTTMRTDRQATTRAFAAELLAPERGLRDRLAGRSGSIDSETVDELADEFRVSSLVIAHQIANHGLGRVET